MANTIFADLREGREVTRRLGTRHEPAGRAITAPVS